MKRFFILFILILFIILAFFPVIRNRYFLPKPQLAPTQKISQINRSFEIKGRNLKGFESGKLKFNLVSAEKVKKIAQQNTPVNASESEEFLIINLEIASEEKETQYISSAKYIRLLDQDKKYAPDFYNQILEIVPQSVKKDEVAYKVSVSQKNFKLQVGEIDGEKQDVEISF